MVLKDIIGCVRGCHPVVLHHAEATNGDIGHVRGFVVRGEC